MIASSMSSVMLIGRSAFEQIVAIHDDAWSVICTSSCSTRPERRKITSRLQTESQTESRPHPQPHAAIVGDADATRVLSGENASDHTMLV